MSDLWDDLKWLWREHWCNRVHRFRWFLERRRSATAVFDQKDAGANDAS